MVRELSPEEARRRVPDGFPGCKTSEDLESLIEIIGQERAVKALEFGLRIKQEGFNLYAAGPRGTGKQNVSELNCHGYGVIT